MMAKRLVLVMVVTFLSAFALLRSASADGLNGDEDFAELARRGFAETVNNAVTNPGTFVTNVGNQGNSYAWSMIWWNGKLYVGTNADAACGTDSGSPDIVGTCPTASQFLGQAIPPIPGANQRPEIWRYTPNPGDARNGTWERVFVSPLTPLLPRLGFLSPQVSRDFGYRTMILCDAGGTERLYVANFGWGGRILFTVDGTTWQQASTNGLPSFTPSSGAGNLGFRAMACKDGGLWVSPAGISTDTDASSDPRIFFNPNPANTSSTWRAISPAGACDPANTGIFDMDVFNGAVYAGAGSTSAGASVCKTAGCLGGTPSTCTAAWTKVVPDGAGRGVATGDNFPTDGGVIRMKSTLDGLYLGLGRSAGDLVPAELIRINSDDTWDLIMGKPRLLSDMQALTPNTFNCNNDPGGGGPIDTTRCFPLSHKGPGFGGGYSATACTNTTTPSNCSFCNGKTTYVWSFAEYDSNGDTSPELYVGTLDRSSSGGGGGGGGVTGVGGAPCSSNSTNPSAFDLWRSDDGTTFSAVSLDGFGNPSASGIRNLAAVQGVGLFVGTANAHTNVGILDPPLTPDPNTGGLQVWLGICPATPGPLVANAGDNKTFFDGLSPDVADGKVTASLDGSLSANRFCGQPITHYNWYKGSLSGSCTTLTSANSTFLTDAIANTGKVSPLPLPLCTAGPAAGCLPHPTPSIGADYTDYPFTLQVIAPDAVNPSCDEVVLRASANLPPTAQITAPPPPTLCSAGRLTILDADGNGSQSVNLSGTCADPPPNSALAASNSCVWSAPLPGVTFSGTTCNGPPCTTTSTTATVAALGSGGGGGGGGNRGLDILLTATDNEGNQGVAKLTVSVRAAVHDVRVTSITTAPAAEDVGQNVTVTVANNGDFPETFTVTLVDSTGGTVSSAQQVTLAAQAICGTDTTQDLFFSWTPTIVPPTTHTLTATATTVLNETNTTNNSLSVSAGVTPVNDPPVANNDTATTTQNTPVTINVLANDTDEEDVHPPTVNSITVPPVNGGVVINADQTVTYTPTTGFTGSDTFKYQAKDSGGLLSNEATVTVTVNVPGPPAAPTNVQRALTGTRQVTVTWTDNAVNETRYELQRCRLSLSRSCSFSNVNTNLSAVPPGTPSYTNTLSSGGTYRYRVRACNTAGCSAYATSSTITVQ